MSRFELEQTLSSTALPSNANMACTGYTAAADATCMGILGKGEFKATAPVTLCCRLVSGTSTVASPTGTR